MTYPRYSLLLACLLAWATASTRPTLAAPPMVAVETILKAKFKRVAGPQSGGAMIYPDSTSTWFDHSVRSPTIDFDGKTY